MKQLLYIGRPNLGENLFATPCLDILSKEYEITLLVPDRALSIFKLYPFIKRSLAGCNFQDKNSLLPISTIDELNRLIKNGEWYYAYHHDNDTKFLENYMVILNMKRYPVLHDKDINIYGSDYNPRTELLAGNKNPTNGFYLSRTRKYMLKLQLMSLQETENFDCTVRCPTFTSDKLSETVVVYQGSRDDLRKLPTETVYEFFKVLPNAIYLVTEETAKELKFKERGVKYIQTGEFSDDSLIEILKLFETRPKTMIGPDSGLTQLASAYKIPMIWLQSRIVLEYVIDPQYAKYCKVFFKSNLTCDQSCLGCAAASAIKNNALPHGLFKVEKIPKGHKELECYKKNDPVCLRYTASEIQKIINLID